MQIPLFKFFPLIPGEAGHTTTVPPSRRVVTHSVTLKFTFVFGSPFPPLSAIRTYLFQISSNTNPSPLFSASSFSTAAFSFFVLFFQFSVLFLQFSVLFLQFSVLFLQFSVLFLQFSVFFIKFSVLFLQFSVLFLQFYVLVLQFSTLSLTNSPRLFSKRVLHIAAAPTFLFMCFFIQIFCRLFSPSSFCHLVSLYTFS